MDFQNWDLREKDRRTFNPPSAPAIGIERRRIHAPYCSEVDEAKLYALDRKASDATTKIISLSRR